MNTKCVTIDRHTIELSNLDKILFPESEITKGDLVDYYQRIASVALPHFRGRALSMHRYPDGIDQDGFFQKNTPDYFPEWIERARLKKEGGDLEYVVVNTEATLVYIANQGCITPHLSLSRVDKPNTPDRLVFDLDPSDDYFTRVQEAAKLLKSLLDELDLTGFVQTTGSRGLHVVVPIERTMEFDAVRDFAKSFCSCLVDHYPDALTIEQRKNKRGNRVFLDYLRNAYGQTSVAPYAVRAIERAPVATPLKWDEVADSNLNPQKYSIANIFRRLAQIEDPWIDFDTYACNLNSAYRKLAKIAA